MKTLFAMLVALNDIESCLDPTCGDNGAIRNRRESNVEPEQCQFCYTPHSKYQFKQDLIELFNALSVAQNALAVIARGGHTDGHAGNFWIAGCAGCIARNAYNESAQVLPSA